MEAHMITELAAQAVALELEIEGLFAVLAAEQARAAELAAGIRAMEMDLDEAWECYEAEYRWAFGERGIFPEIPKRWFPVVFRFIERLDAALTHEQKSAFMIMQVKEKYGNIRIYYNAGYEADRIAETLVEQAESEVEHIETVHKRLQ